MDGGGAWEKGGGVEELGIEKKWYTAVRICMYVWGEGVAGLPRVQNVSTHREAAKQHGYCLFHEFGTAAA